MANPAFFRPVFDALATSGVIGDPSGKPAYAYLRVSDSDQAEEGRSGLPRQIQHVHEAAKRDGYKVPWDLVFADDHSGFVFEDRPQLSQLRSEIRSPRRRARLPLSARMLPRLPGRHAGAVRCTRPYNSLCFRRDARRTARAVY